MADLGRRLGQGGPDYYQDVSVPTADGKSTVVLSLLVCVIAIWAVDRFVLHHAIWNAVYHQAAPTLIRWRWEWATFWHRFG